MISISDLKPGLKVRIVDRWAEGYVPPPGSLLNQWMGQIMTISTIRFGHYSLDDIFMEETGEHIHWYLADIAEILQEDPIEEPEPDFLEDIGVLLFS